jgi:hypothetical protein
VENSISVTTGFFTVVLVHESEEGTHHGIIERAEIVHFVALKDL